MGFKQEGGSNFFDRQLIAFLLDTLITNVVSCFPRESGIGDVWLWNVWCDFLEIDTPRNLGILNSCFLTSPTSTWDLYQFLVIKIYKNFGQKGGPVGCKVNSQNHHFLGERLGLLTGSYKILRVCVSHRVLGWWRMTAAEPNQTPYGSTHQDKTHEKQLSSSSEPSSPCGR